MEEYIPKNLPLDTDVDFESKEILKKSIKANKALAKLNGIVKIIPNQSILINSLTLQEAKDSSEIENIITTHDDLYKTSIDISNITKESKEVQNYKSALLKGYHLVKDNGFLLNRYILEIQEELEQNSAGIRKQTGTMLKNPVTGEIKFIPPQNHQDIINLLSNLEKYINEKSEIDPLINMAIIHYQFETIHPFYDGNGRTGRIINILYLILNGLLDIPVLYLSKYIIKNRSDYYRLLQEVRTKNSWQEWILYMLDGIEKTSFEMIDLVSNIKNLMDKTKLEIREKLPKIYSKDLLEILFMHPYTKIDFLVNDLRLHRETASRYLKELENIGILKSVKISRSKFFINTKLYDILKKGL